MGASMLGPLKCAAVSAVLSAGVVGVLHAPAKPYADRLPASFEAPARAAAPVGAKPAAPGIGAGPKGASEGRGASKGDRLASAACGGAAWPYIPAPCVEGAGAPGRPVRVITVERRPAEGVSVLERVPAADVVAARR